MVHGAHDRARVAANRIGIEIEAALAFGTGHHGTTRGCLLALDWIAKTRRPRRVLDIGTGTGVLAIAAAKALARPVLASDIDPEAVAHRARQCAPQRRRAARAMSARKGLTAPQVSQARRRSIWCSPISCWRRSSALPRPMRPLLAPGAHVVLSGLLARRRMPRSPPTGRTG